jgi:predicted phage terminase large subunit-like protein
MTSKAALSERQLRYYLDRINQLPLEQQEEIASLISKAEIQDKTNRARTEFLPFVEMMWPGFIHGRHHRKMAAAFERVVNGDLKRLMICMPPRHTKSEFASYLLPSWFLGRYPSKKVIQSSFTAELATGFGRKVRNLVGGDTYKRVFPNVTLRADSKAAGRWNTNYDGTYFAVGVGGNVTGMGADLLIIDDPHSEQEMMVPDLSGYGTVAWEWYTSGPRQRLQPGGAIVVVMTRWHKLDLVGRLLRAMQEGDGDQWELIEFPAILPSGNPLWPEFWSIEELLKVKNSGIPLPKWNAQYQQNPTSEEGAIIKREWWKTWESDKLPKCEFIIQCWDTAFEKTKRSDPSACTTWGVFYRETAEKRIANIILLDALCEQMEFPDLKVKAVRAYKTWQPDALIVEKKASGSPLIYELRGMGLPVGEYTPSRGQDKITRVNSIADMFSSGVVWRPAKRWADEVVEQFAEFPNGEHDDLVDSGTLALMRFRQGGFLRLPSDEEEKDEGPRVPVAYY